MRLAVTLLFVLAHIVACADTGGPLDRAQPDAAVNDAAADAAQPDAGEIDAGVADSGDPTPVEVFLPRTGLDRDDIAVIVARGDPVSEAIAAEYVARRGLREDQVVAIDIPTGNAVIAPADFAPLRDAVEAALGDDVQATLLTWTQPYRVGCMSITSAFAFGFDERFCNRSGGACGPTDPVAYPERVTRPYEALGFRPSMMMAVRTSSDAVALIDRGVAADDTFPTGDGYFYRTSDTARSVRFRRMALLPDLWDHDGGLTLFYFEAGGFISNEIWNTENMLFYLTGLTRVRGIETNTYRPGALADHLTSFGGRVPNAGGQMSVTAWLEAGVTASFGTTVEPCNFLQKFPDPVRLVEAYFHGATAIEGLLQVGRLARRGPIRR